MNGRDASKTDNRPLRNSSLEFDSQFGCWCVSKGMAGMVNQMSGLAHLLGLEARILTTRLRFPWSVVPIPLIPKAPYVLQNPQQLQGTPPRVVISCGRQGVVPALLLKKQFGNSILAVHIQDPRVDPGLFDLVIIPRHDYMRGDNVYLTNGAIHYVTPERLQLAAESEVARNITDGDRPIVAVLIGGPNGYYKFDNSDLTAFIQRLQNVDRKHRVRMVLLPSNRTPARITDRLQAEFGEKHFVWDRKSENPYFAALALASHIVVTGDSVSMITEAASTGRPVFVQHLTEKRRATRFRRFHQMFADDGITRPFEGTLTEWHYDPPNDTPRVAELIQEMIATSANGPCRPYQNNAA